MRLQALVSATAFAVATALVGTGAVHAEPAPIEPGTLWNYEVTLGNTDVTASLDYGYWKIGPDGAMVSMMDEEGNLVENVPTSYTLDGTQHQIPTEVSEDGRKLVMRPARLAVPMEPTPVASDEVRDAAWNNMMQQIVVGWNNQGPVSTALGAAIGFGIGCLSIFPNFIAGCIIGTVIGAGVGAAVGIVQGNPEVAPAVNAWIESYVR